MISVLFVCLGNICRSPALEETLRSFVEKKGLSDQIRVDSCGLNSYFLNSQADPKMIAAAKKRGIFIHTKAKFWINQFFEEFDYIFVVDNQILEMIKSSTNSKKFANKVYLATEFSTHFPQKEMPDPYMGGEKGFELIMEMAEDACVGIVNHLGKKL